MPKIDPQTGEELVEDAEFVATAEREEGGYERYQCDRCEGGDHSNCELNGKDAPCSCFCRVPPELFEEPYAYLIAFRDETGRRYFHRGTNEWICAEIRSILARLQATAHRSSGRAENL